MEVPTEALPMMENMSTSPPLHFSLLLFLFHHLRSASSSHFLYLFISLVCSLYFFAFLPVVFLFSVAFFLIFHPCTALGYVCVREKRDVRESEHYISQDSLGCMHPRLLSSSFFCLLRTGIVITVPAAPVTLFILLCVL